MPINYSHQTVQIGRFLSQENISILSGLPRNPMNSQKAYITSLFPQTAYYSVERIIDGMGNATELSYEYLFFAYNDETHTVRYIAEFGYKTDPYHLQLDW